MNIQTPDLQAQAKTADLHRMAIGGHLCPHGLKAKHLLQTQGYAVRDHLLTSRAEVDAFKAQHDVKTTPQIFIGGAHIGGHDDLRRHMGLSVVDRTQTTYRPVMAVFAIAALIALATQWAAFGALEPVKSAEWFIATSMCLLAMLKLQDVDRFATMFLTYDLLARRWVPYGRVYPYAELLAGVLMLAGLFPWLSIPIAFFIGSIGAVSVAKAVWIEKRELKCACVGGNSNVPLGFLSFTENVMMLGMAVWMLATL